MKIKGHLKGRLLIVGIAAIAYTAGTLTGTVKVASAQVASNYTCTRSSETSIGSSMSGNDTLEPGERLVSSDPYCGFELKFKQNPNTQAYYLTLTTAAREIWTKDLGTSATSPVATLTTAGNFEVRQGATLLFETDSTATSPTMSLQPDGNLVIRDSSGTSHYDIKSNTNGLGGRQILGDRILPGEFLYLTENNYLEEETTAITSPYGAQARLSFKSDTGQVSAISTHRGIAQMPLANSNITMTTDGDSSQTDAKYLHLNDSGLVEVYGADGSYVGELELFSTSASTSGATLEYAKIQRDFNFVVYWSGGGSLIASAESDTHITDRIYRGETLYPGMKMTAGNFTLTAQGDGNVVVWNTATNQCKWEPDPPQSHTGVQNIRSTFQNDGNFVLKTRPDAESDWITQWHAGSNSASADDEWMMRLQSSDGNLVIYDGSVAQWHTGTAYDCN